MGVTALSSAPSPPPQDVTQPPAAETEAVRPGHRDRLQPAGVWSYLTSSSSTDSVTDRVQNRDPESHIKLHIKTNPFFFFFPFSLSWALFSRFSDRPSSPSPLHSYGTAQPGRVSKFLLAERRGRINNNTTPAFQGWIRSCSSGASPNGGGCFPHPCLVETVLFASMV